MEKTEQDRLEASGWKFGDFALFAEFLGLDDVERQLIELRVELGLSTRRLRGVRNLTQKALAKQIESTQSRVSKIEEADPEVSLDLMFRAFFAVGGTLADLTSHSPITSVEPELPKAKPKPRVKRVAQPR